LDDPLQANEFMLAGLALAAGLGVDENFCIQNNLAYNAPDLVKKYRDYGQPREADTFLRRGVSHARQALTLAGDGTHPYREGIAHDNLAMLLALQGDFAEADEHFTRAASLAATHGFADLAIATAHYRARAALLRGDLPVGIAGLQRVLEQAKAKNQKPIIASVNLQLAEAYERAEQPVLALAHYKAFHEAERSFNTTVAQTRSNMLSNMFELENSRLEAERARLEAELLRGRSAGLEAEMQQLQTQMEELNRHAQQDALTGLWNRRYLDNQLPKLFERMKQANTPVCLAMADIDFFKSVNDRFGHPVGDQVLVRTARLLLRGARQMDIVARFGGEEFLLVFAGLAPEAAAAACEKLRLAVAEYDWGQIHPALRVTISLGLACGPAADFAAAVVAADRLLYEAKQGGRNTIKLG
jgi:diguanylate cyclase (GGDEF)-like protein